MKMSLVKLAVTFCQQAIESTDALNVFDGDVAIKESLNNADIQSETEHIVMRSAAKNERGSNYNCKNNWKASFTKLMLTLWT
ncbi:MAG: hypothetical protein CM15mV145_270 [uncultured marine virus]|nr:MAG: hypothetical protein CM15mV145_270 [uncultured marine virus]